MSLGTSVPGEWPNDADGDVLRRMDASGFDFAAAHVVDFNIDLPHWPPAPSLVAEVQRRYPDSSLFEPESGHRGYIQIRVRAPVTYDLVTSVQREMSELAGPFGGVCESWGVMQQ